MLILTAARREEILKLRWREVDIEHSAIRLRAERTKVKEGRVIPLSGAAEKILAGLPQLGTDGFVFTLNGRSSFANVGHAKARLDRLIGQGAGQPLAPWRVHDLRRTVATGLQRLGNRLEVIEAVLGHVAGSRAGIVGVYQRHRFEPEARAALAAWGEHIAQLVSRRDGEVVVPFALRS